MCFFVYIPECKLILQMCTANNYVFEIWLHLIPETFYWFGDNNYTEWEELFKQYNPPPYKLPRMTGAYSFGVAGIEKFNGTKYFQRICVEISWCHKLQFLLHIRNGAPKLSIQFFYRMEATDLQLLYWTFYE